MISLMKRAALLAILFLLAGCSAPAALPTPTLVPANPTPSPVSTATTLPGPTASITPSIVPSATKTSLPPSLTPTTGPSVTLDPAAALGGCPQGAGSGTGSRARLTVINKSGFPVRMKLVETNTGACHLLTVPAGSEASPTIKVFEITTGTYQRTTFSCGDQPGIGSIIIDGSLRLTFSACTPPPSN